MFFIESDVTKSLNYNSSILIGVNLLFPMQQSTRLQIVGFIVGQAHFKFNKSIKLYAV
jgi:hypothetical protein